jgi:hypothetical protein
MKQYNWEQDQIKHMKVGITFVTLRHETTGVFKVWFHVL